MSAGNCLEVRVNGELVLDAGICEETPGPLTYARSRIHRILVLAHYSVVRGLLLPH